MTGLQDPQITTHDAQTTAVVRGRITMDAMAAFYDSSFGQVAEVLAAQGVTPTGGAFGYYLSVPTNQVELEVGFTTATPVTPQGEVSPSELPAGTVARATHAGAYDGLAGSWGALMTWVHEQGRTPAGPMWEVYVTEPTPDTDPDTLRTDLYVLLTD